MPETNNGPAESRRLKIIYIAGTKNSGSTMLEALIGAAPGVQALGQFAAFYRYACCNLCECGETAASCRACLAVREAVASHALAPQFSQLSRLPLKERRAHWLVAKTRPSKAYAALTDAMYEAAAAATGASVLVDSSKNLSRAGAIASTSRHDVRVIHLVRDGRAYLSSRRRRYAALGNRDRPVREHAAWLAKNLAATMLLRRLVGTRYQLCRYEDLVLNPECELARIASFANISLAGIASKAVARGIPRHYLFEPKRHLDYKLVRLDQDRRMVDEGSKGSRWTYWLLGGFVSAIWGYSREGTHS